MKRTILILIPALVLLAMTAGAQTASEAYRLTQSDLFGTARNLGTGNSMFAIGPDMSVIGQNPSGLAGFRMSEFSFSLGVDGHQYSTSLGRNSAPTVSNAGRVSLPNLGFVVASRPQYGSWTTSNWAIGINRLADYRRHIRYAGQSLGSMTDSWRENAAGIDPDNLNGFEEGLAYTSGAIYDFEEDNLYESDYALSPAYPLYKQEESALTGGKSEFYLAYATNFKEKILLGASVNLPLVNFTEDRYYEEADETGDEVPFFNSLSYTRYINTTGYGFNAKFGITLKPSPAFSIALAAHSPTKLLLTDNFNTTLTYDFTAGEHDGPIRAESPFGSFEYALRTPWRFMAGAGLVAGKQGFLGVSVAFTDNGKMRYDYSVRGNGNQYAQIEREVNQSIRNNYTSTLDLRFGGEWVLNQFRIRGGAGMTQSAFVNDQRFNTSYHAGMGYRGEMFFIDLGYRYQSTEEGFLPYETIEAPQPLAITELQQHRLITTVGFKF